MNPIMLSQRDQFRNAFMKAEKKTAVLMAESL
jgi:hypothetical protein